VLTENGGDIALPKPGVPTWRTASAISACVRSHSRRSRMRRRRLYRTKPPAPRRISRTGTSTPAIIAVWTLDLEEAETRAISEADGDGEPASVVLALKPDGSFKVELELVGRDRVSGALVKLVTGEEGFVDTD